MRKLFVGLLLLAACEKSGEKPSSGDAGAATPSPVAAASDAGAETYGVMIGGPYAVEKVVAAVNPQHRAPYAGPKGTLRGTIRIDGDPPPDTKLKFREDCKESPVTFGKLFRVGLDKALADALVAVTQYADRGFVPAESEAVRVNLQNCVPDKLTYTLTYGQRLDIYNVGSAGTFLPYLDGEKGKAIMIAVPKGPSIKLYANGPSPAHYMLRDDLGSGLAANVFLLNYATHAVTTLDGKYEIRNIPVGKVRVDVMLPVLSKSEGKEIEIVEGNGNTFDLTLHFDAEKDIPKRAGAADADAGAPSAASSSSTKPAGSTAPPKKAP
jgi:hypothetical protein